MDQDRANLLMKRINESPFNVANGIYAVRIDDGFSEVAVELTEKSRNIWGIPHGGLLFALADVAAGFAAQSLSDGRVVTISANVNFIQATQGKTLRAIANKVRSGTSVGFFDVSVLDDQEHLLMTGQYVMHYSKRQE